MKTVILTILALMALAGCNGCAKPDTLGSQDPALESEFKADFAKDLKAATGHDIDFGNIQVYFYEGSRKGDVGLCSTAMEGKAMSIQKQVNKQIMYLVFIHEVGHCIYGLKHRDDKPAIMNSKFTSDLENIFANFNTLEKQRLIKEMLE